VVGGGAATLSFARQSDLIVVVSARRCRAVIAALRLRTLPIPLALDPVTLNLARHHRYDTDMAHTWLRGKIRAALRAIARSPDDPRCVPDHTERDAWHA